MTDQERNGFDNLILLCLPHAEEIDLPVFAERYPVAVLRQWKAEQVNEGLSAGGVTLGEDMIERSIAIATVDTLLDFTGAQLTLGGGGGQAPGSGGGGGGAIGPGARGGDGGPGGDVTEFTLDATELPARLPVQVGVGGRPGVLGMPGECGAHTRFGTVTVAGGGRAVHQLDPDATHGIGGISIAAAVFADYVDNTAGVIHLSRAGWDHYLVPTLPHPFRAGLCVWVDASVADAS